MKKYRFLSFISAVFLMLPFAAVCHAESGDYSDLPGDVNSDGIVNVLDVELLSYQLIGIQNEVINEANADLNHNQTLDIIDLVDLILLILGIDNSNLIDQIIDENDNLIVTETPCTTDDTGSSDITDISTEIISDTTDQSPDNTAASESEYSSIETTADTTADLLSDAESKADAVFSLINEIRVSNGLKPFEKIEILDCASMTRAAEIAQKFSHKRPDGSSCFSILDEYDMFYMAAGENIAYGSSTAEGVVEQWMNSEGHRENIMNPNYSYLGVGYYKTDESNYCWTQLFIG